MSLGFLSEKVVDCPALKARRGLENTGDAGTESRNGAVIEQLAHSTHPSLSAHLYPWGSLERRTGRNVSGPYLEQADSVLV